MSSLPEEKFYRLLHPRPVYIIGSGEVNKEVNLMAASWVSPISDFPKIIMFSCSKDQYTFELIEKYKKFSVNITDNIQLIWKVGTSSGKEINKIKEFNIEIVEGKLKLPILKENLGFLECEVKKEVEFEEYKVYFGEVINFEGKNIDYYGWKEFWKIPLHKGGKAFTFPNKKLFFP